MPTAKEWIEALGLARHPEGGWFRETYRATEGIAREHLPARFDGPRSFSTSIYYLLGRGEVSALHRIRQDEMWHFHDGAPLALHLIDPEGTHRVERLGREPGTLHPQAVAPAGWLFAAESEGEYSLVGCTVAPGFDFADLEMPSRAALLERYPHLAAVIDRLAPR